ncbi:hypothetical protein V8E51_005258 [Hyaloscypha variabilis]
METLELGISRLGLAAANERDHSFLLFPRLPTEIRLQIWYHAVEAIPGRILSLWVDEWWKDRNFKFQLSQPNLQLANVSREAREAVFQAYQPLFPGESRHSQVRVCLRKDTTILSEDFSRLHQLHLKYHTDYLAPLLETLGPEKCLEFRELALEVRTNWQWGRWIMDYWHLYPWQGCPATKTAHQVFPKLEKMIYIPLISSHLKSKTYDIPVARAHIGELKFVPRESGKWDKGRKKWADQLQWMLRGTKEPKMEYEVMQLGIVGGPEEENVE